MKGIKNTISKDRFTTFGNESKGFTQGIFAFDRFKNINLATSNFAGIYNTMKDNFINWIESNKVKTDNLYVYTRYKNIVFAFDTESKAFYKVEGLDYFIPLIEYFLSKNPDYKDNITIIKGIVPVDLRARKTNIQKQADSIGISL